MPRRLLIKTDGLKNSTAPDGYKFMGLNEDGSLRLLQGSEEKDLLGDNNGNVEIKSIEEGDGSVTAETLIVSQKNFETDTIVVGTYEGVQPSGGSGTGLTVTVVVSEWEEFLATIQSVTVTDGGTGYEIGDVVSIATSELGADPSTESTSVELGAEDLNLTQQQSILVTATGISMPYLPTSDPGVAGQLWNNGGTLKISTEAVAAKTPPPIE